MNITVVGTGYVGLVTGACLADVGNTVTCVDTDERKISDLKNGFIPFYEPGLTDIVKKTIASGSLIFTTEFVVGDILFICVGTPGLSNGTVDMDNMWKVIDTIIDVADSPKIIVIKSTVPPGTNASVNSKLRNSGVNHVVVSNPEFLREGSAVQDFFAPDRVVIGTINRVAQLTLKDLYLFTPCKTSILVMSAIDAELTKYASNSFLATKISFINQIADICEGVGGNIKNVQKGMGEDPRIGYDFLTPGLGYGGSCFPKDVDALRNIAGNLAPWAPNILDSVHEINEDRLQSMVNKIKGALKNDIKGKVIVVLGASFKPKTDDIRDSQALKLVDLLLEGGAFVTIHDPRATDNILKRYSNNPKVCVSIDAQEATKGSETLVLATMWSEYNRLSWDHIKVNMKQPIIVDCWNMFNKDDLKQRGFKYYGIGNGAN